MEEDDLPDELDALLGDGDEEPAPDDPPRAPAFRATIAGDRVTVIGHMPFMLGGPVAGAAFREREAEGVTLADVAVEGDELIVDLLAHGGGERAERALERWAALAGYRRIWFPGRVVALDAAAPGQAEVRCPGCGHRWAEHRPQFWLAVREAGQFPSYCLLCGHDLPQWEVTPPSTSGGVREVAPQPR
jgi:hypothetical protein